MRRMIFSIPMLLLLFAGCNHKEQSQPLPPGQATNAALAVNEFAFDLYRQLSPDDGNIFFSPASISTALAMTWAGTEGATAKETAEVLHLGTNRPQVLADFSQLLNGFVGTDSTFTLHVANRLWGQKEFPFEARFLSEIQNNFSGGLEACDFLSSAEMERQKINAWVADRTANKIQDLLPAGSVTKNTRLVLTNAVYFLGQWQKPFEKIRTRDEKFHTADSSQLSVPTMKLDKNFPYFSCENYALVGLPYQGDELEFLVMLPHEVLGLDQIMSSLSAFGLQAHIDAMAPQKVDVWLPKLNLEQTINLNSALKTMGMNKVFEESLADFSRLTQQPGFFVSSVVHKAFLTVDELGTEAAAATGMTFGITSMPKPSIKFIADHPFVFLIRQKSTGAILFMGRCEKP